MLLSYAKEQVMHVIHIIAEKNAMSTAGAMLNQKTFSQYKGICTGKDVVICGAGPTLQKYQPIEGAVHIACNRAFLYDKVKYDFIFAQDWDGIKMVSQELINYKGNNCVKLLARSFEGEKTIPESYALQCNAKQFVTDSCIYSNGYKSHFVNDIDHRVIGGMPNVGLSVLQFALFLNPAKLYIVGCDMSGVHFSNKNQNNFEINREKKELISYWKKDREKLIMKWNEFKVFANTFYPETEIISVNPVGLKGLFKDLYQ